MEVGEQAEVVGDDVPERTAIVADLGDDGREAVLEFEDTAGPT